MFNQQEKPSALDRVIKWKGIIAGVCICLMLSLFILWLFIGNPLTYHARAALLPVRIRQDKRIYFLPECSRYAQLKEGKFFELATSQEAELSGYLPAKSNCSEQTIRNRRTLERQLFGEIKPTSETVEHRIMNQRQVSIESEIQDLQSEIKNKQDDLEDRQNDIKQKLDEIKDED